LNWDVFGAMLMHLCFLIIIIIFITAFAPMNGGRNAYDEHDDSNSWKQPLDAERYFSQSESD
jgi:hypothetical protein